MPEAVDYLGPEAQARVEIDNQLTAAGWLVQRHKQTNLGAGRGVAVREFPMAEGHGDARTAETVTRVSRMQGKPRMRRASTVMRSNSTTKATDQRRL